MIKDFKFDVSTALKIAAAVAGIFVVIFFVWLNRRTVIEIKGEGGATSIGGALTGAPCPEPTRRPVAVMLASDPVARPLAGISQADLVIEMPVTPDGVTRMMAIFQCQTPSEIGSIRSARSDFIPLAASYGAVLAHWGGEQDALARLNSGAIDNLDALRYEGTAYYRKAGVKPPHNGFTTLEKLFEAAAERKYDLANTFIGYPRGTSEKPRNLASLVSEITPPYRAPYDVTWKYDATAKRYRRLRNGQAELDLNGEAVKAAVVVVLKTKITPLYDQYLTVTVEGSGQATVYQNELAVPATWHKDKANLNTPLTFSDAHSKPLALEPGPIWIEIVPDTVP